MYLGTHHICGYSIGLGYKHIIRHISCLNARNPTENSSVDVTTPEQAHYSIRAGKPFVLNRVKSMTMGQPSTDDGLPNHGMLTSLHTISVSRRCRGMEVPSREIVRIGCIPNVCLFGLSNLANENAQSVMPPYNSSGSEQTGPSSISSGSEELPTPTSL